jgi:hypothetical protein
MPVIRKRISLGCDANAVMPDSDTMPNVRQNDLKTLLADVQQIAENNPGSVLLAAAVLGFLVARAFLRD